MVLKEDVNSGRIGQPAILGIRVPHVSEATSALFPPIGPHDINIILLLGAADADNSSVGLSEILDGQIGEERSVWGGAEADCTAKCYAGLQYDWFSANMEEPGRATLTSARSPEDGNAEIILILTMHSDEAVGKGGVATMEKIAMIKA